MTAAFRAYDGLLNIRKKKKWCNMDMWRDYQTWQKPSCQVQYWEEEDEAVDRSGGKLASGKQTGLSFAES